MSRTVRQLTLLATVLTATMVAPTLARAQEAPRRDLLTYGQGVLFVSQNGLQSGSSGTALLAIDGDPYRMGLTSDRNGPVEFVYKLPAVTTFDRFAVPNVIEQPGNTTFVKNVSISGSAEGPDSGFEELAALVLETHGPDEDVTEVIPSTMAPVRWVKVRFEGGINIEPGDEGRTVIWFSELIGNGTQETQALSTAFDGLWDLRATERLDRRGLPLELHQDGAVVSGCFGTLRFEGNATGRVARVSGTEVDTGRPGAMILVADDDGTINASVSTNNGRFGARTAVDDPDVAESACVAPPEPPTACGTNVYVNFEVNSAVLRPESDPILADTYRRLVAEGAVGVTIQGHTSTEGTEEYNLDLSRRRAQAVVDDLVRRGFDPARITASGAGESQPLISPDATEAARELNRRVEVSCGSAAGL